MILNKHITESMNCCCTILLRLLFLTGCCLLVTLSKSQPFISSTAGSADQDWDRLIKAAEMFPSADSYELYKKLTPVGMKQYEDAYYLKKMNLAEEFWNRHQTDKRRTRAMEVFLSADPLFIDQIDSLAKNIIDSVPKRDWARIMRTLPYDKDAFKRWITKGNEMVDVKLNSAKTLDEKEAAAFALFARDFRIARRWNLKHFSVDSERGFWSLHDDYYWSQFFQRFDNHVEQFAKLPVLANRANDFLSTLNGISSNLSHYYWEKLLTDIGKENSDLESSPGKVALLKVVREHLKSIDTKNGQQSLDMKFVSLQGENIDLADLKGKVVLIDFWASWCQPCVHEFPHLKELYKQYSSQGFEIIGINLDEDIAKKQVIAILSKYGVSWPQRFEGKGFNSDSYRLLYGINSLPVVWLIDRTGKIIHENARGKVLENLLSSIFEIGSRHK